MSDSPITRGKELREAFELVKYWADFCDCDAVPPDFADRMEAAGYIELRSVTKDDLEEPFAAEKGIEPDGSVWQLTTNGRAVIDAIKADHAHD